MDRSYAQETLRVYRSVFSLRTLGIVLSCLVAAIVVLAVVLYHGLGHSEFRRVSIGDSREKVVSLLGQPVSVYQKSVETDTGYMVTGYAFEPLRGYGEVLIYFGGDQVCYLLISDNRVADMHVEGS